MAVFIPKDRDCYYMSFRVNGKQIFRSCKTKSKKEAEAVERRVRTELESKPSSTALEGSIPLSGAIQVLYEERWCQNRDGDQARKRAEVCCEILGDPPLDKVDRSAIQTVKDALMKSNKAPSTVNGHLAALRTVLKVACEDWGVLARVPKVKMVAQPQGRTRVISADEEQALLSYLRKGVTCAGPANRYGEVHDVTIVLMETGMRLGEVLALTKEHVNLNNMTLQVQPEDAKSGKPRLVPMTQRCHAVIQRCLDDGGLLFKVRKDYVSRIWKRARAAIGVGDDPEFVPHACRHTVASRLLNSGRSIYQVQQLLGHSSIQVTVNMYGHLDVAGLHRLVND